MSPMWVLVLCLLTVVCLDATWTDYTYDNAEDEDSSDYYYDEESAESLLNPTADSSNHSNRFRKLKKLTDILTRLVLEESDDDFDGDDFDNLPTNESLEKLLTPYIDNFNNAKTRTTDFGDVELIKDGIQNDARMLQSSNRIRLSKKSQHQNLQENNFEAELHIRKIQYECNCSKSKPRLVSVQSVYPNYTKQYVPHHTLLYRCGDDVGYCIIDRMSCIPRRIEQVDLYFKVITKSGIKTEKLSFDNHTECFCGTERDRDGTTTSPIFKSTKIVDTTSEQPITTKRPSCKCTREFSVHITEDGQCECNCYSKHKDCLRLKKGREFLGLLDRMCIRKGQCQKPVCEFGKYLDLGRCPRRYEKKNSSTGYSRKRRTI